MKKTLLFAAALVVAMSSCSKSSVVESDIAPKAIGFESFIDKSTKATDITVANIAEATVKGYYTEKPWAKRASTLSYFDRVLSITAAGVATYTNTVYWPTSAGSVSFFAYAPTAEVSSFTAATDAKEMTVTFATEATVAAQTDFVTAQSLECTSTTASAGVNLAFNHALSKIGFSAKIDTDYTGLTFKVTGLEVNYTGAAVANSGVYSFNTTPSWAPSTTSFYTLDASAGSMIISGGVDMTTTAQNLVADNSYLMLIPQTLAADALTAKITYTTTDAATSLPLTTVKFVALPTLTLEEGTYYNYVFNITADAITFANVIVNPWTNYTGTPIGSDI